MNNAISEYRDVFDISEQSSSFQTKGVRFVFNHRPFARKRSWSSHRSVFNMKRFCSGFFKKIADLPKHYWEIEELY